MGKVQISAHAVLKVAWKHRVNKTCRTTDPFEANFSESWDTLFLAKVCLEHKISYEILSE